MKLAWAILPAAALGLAAGLLAGRRAPEEVSRRPARGAAPAAGAAAPEGRRDPERVERIFRAAEDRGPLRSLVDRLRESLAALGEEDLLDVRRRLAKLLEAEPARLSELLQAFESESDEDVLALLAETIGGDAAAMANPAVVEAMIRMAEGAAVPARRGAALLVLLKLPQHDARAEAAVLRLARSESEPRDLRVSALAALAAWMQTHPGGDARLAETVLGVARAAGDGEVRGHAIQAVALLARPAAAETVESLAGFLRDPSPENRALAALGLGNPSGEARGAAVRHLEAAIAGESAAEAQRGMLIHLVRAAGADAEGALGRVAAQHPRLDADVRDYLEILRGERDAARVWEEKQRRDFARGAVPGADAHSD